MVISGLVGGAARMCRMMNDEDDKTKFREGRLIDVWLFDVE